MIANSLFAVLAALPLQGSHWEIPVYRPDWGYAPRICRVVAVGQSPEELINDYALKASLCMEAFGVRIDGPEALRQALEDVRFGRVGL